MHGSAEEDASFFGGGRERSGFEWVRVMAEGQERDKWYRYVVTPCLFVRYVVLTSASFALWGLACAWIAFLTHRNQPSTVPVSTSPTARPPFPYRSPLSP